MDINEIIERTNHVPSSVHPPEQEMWLRRLKDLPGNPVIVDFGTGWGKSASSLALACPQGTVYTFDLGDVHINQTCSAEEYIEKVNNYINQAGVSNYVFTRENSHTKEWDKEIDVLNDDSDHTYPTTKGEIERWVPFVKQGGLVFFHDYEHPRCPGVRQAIDEYIEEHHNLELLEVTQAGEVKCACYKKL